MNRKEELEKALNINLKIVDINGNEEECLWEKDGRIVAGTGDEELNKALGYKKLTAEELLLRIAEEREKIAFEELTEMRKRGEI